MSRPKIIPAKAAETRQEFIAVVANNIVFLAIDIYQGDVVDDVLVIDHNIPVVNRIIAGDALIELKSVRPKWHPTKDSEYYDERDLWYILDKIDAGNLTSVVPTNLQPF